MRSAAFGGIRLRRGAALMEVIISVLLIGIAVSTIMGSVLSTSLQSGHSRDREQAAVSLNQLLQELKNYVTADSTTPNNPDAPGTGPAGWTLPGDACDTCWALDPAFNPHDVSSRLPQSLTQNGAKMTYTVNVVPVNGLNTSLVTATLTWTPQ